MGRKQVSEGYVMSSALVTGASSGIGLEIAKILSKDVDRLVITSRREDLLNELADSLSELKKTGVTVTALCPGYVETGFQKVSGMRLTGVEIWSSLPVDKVANIAVRAMRKGRREVIPGFVNWWVPILGRVLPISIQLWIVRASLMMR